MTQSIKMVVVGSPNVGKSSWIISVETGKFPTHGIPTVLDDVSVLREVDGIEYSISLWDTLGIEDYNRLRPLSYPQTDVFVLFYSVSSPGIFSSIPTFWKEELKLHCPNVPILLVGGKCDLRYDNDVLEELERKQLKPISFEEGQEVAKLIQASGFIECSSATYKGVETVLQQALQLAIDARKNTNTNNRQCICM